MKTAMLALIVLLGPYVLASARHNPIPLIYQPLTPAMVEPGHETFTLRVHGTGFVAGATVKIDGTPLQTVFRSLGELWATVPSRDVATPGTRTITVSNSGGIDSNAIYLPIREASSAVSLATAPIKIAGGEIVLGDFNNDHRPDLAITAGADNSSVSAIYLNQSSRFQQVTGPHFLGGTIVPGNAVGDFNNDGNADLMSCSYPYGVPEYENCRILLGDGTGNLLLSSKIVEGGGTAADMNGDGVLDLITVFYDGFLNYYLYVYSANRKGGYGEPFSIEIPHSPNNTWGVPVVGDFNGDGKLDVAVSGSGYMWPGPGPVAVFLGNGDGTLQGEVDYQAPVWSDFATVADVNGDGILDIITAGVSVMLGHGDGTFEPGFSVALSHGYSSPGAIVLGCINGDNQLDAAVVIRHRSTQSFDILLGQKDGTFQGPVLQMDEFGDGSLGIADFNNDGLLDFVLGGLPDDSSKSTLFLQTQSK